MTPFGDEPSDRRGGHEWTLWSDRALRNIEPIEPGGPFLT
jgi:hypothetical protein